MLTKSGLVIVTSGVCPVLQEDLDSPGVQAEINGYDKAIEQKIPKIIEKPFKVENEIERVSPELITIGG